MKKATACLALALALVAVPALAQQHGNGESGGGCGDVLGDLIHLKRATTGQPILAQRWVALPQDQFGWAYCPIAVEADGVTEIPFVPLTCDPDDPTGSLVVAVDYFGRLSGGRTKERNSRMHFNEVISNIKMPETQSVGLDETGRLLLGYECDAPGGAACAEWAVIDSPMENLALYTRLMKYGHFQTDPGEVDTWAHGDPTTLPQYHPALTEADWQKFQPAVRHLLPGDGLLFCDTGDCVLPQALGPDDFVTAGAALGGAANKTGKITVDLVQYMNRILKITLTTEATAATPATLPALVQVCWEGPDPTLADTDGDGDGVADQDPDYACTGGAIAAHDALPGYAASTDVKELFVDFAAAAYVRPEHLVKVIGPVDDTTPRVWLEVSNVSLMSWLDLANEVQEAPQSGLEAFVAASSDALRAIEFVHNYAIPEDLGLDFVPDSYKVTVKEKIH